VLVNGPAGSAIRTCRRNTPCGRTFRKVEHRRNALAVRDLVLRPDLPPKRKAFRDGPGGGRDRLARASPRSAAEYGAASTPPTARESRSLARTPVYGLQLSERVAIFGLQPHRAARSKNIVHDRGLYAAIAAVAVRRKQVTFSPQSADRQLGRYHLVPSSRSAPASFSAPSAQTGGRRNQSGDLSVPPTPLLPSGWADRTQCTIQT
jgi:hypothetical protein